MNKEDFSIKKELLDSNTSYERLFEILNSIVIFPMKEKNKLLIEEVLLFNDNIKEILEKLDYENKNVISENYYEDIMKRHPNEVFSTAQTTNNIYLLEALSSRKDSYLNKIASGVAENINTPLVLLNKIFQAHKKSYNVNLSLIKNPNLNVELKSQIESNLQKLTM